MFIFTWIEDESTRLAEAGAVVCLKQVQWSQLMFKNTRFDCDTEKDINIDDLQTRQRYLVAEALELISIH